MNLKEQILNDLKDAMKAGEKERRDTLRLLSSAIKQVEVDSQKELDEAGIIQILKKEAKRREESIADLQKAGRETTQEEQELALINTYLPEQLDRTAIETLVKEAIAEAGATSAKDTGNVMKILMPKVGGRADGKLVNEVVRGLLS